MKRFAQFASLRRALVSLLLVLSLTIFMAVTAPAVSADDNPFPGLTVPQGCSLKYYGSQSGFLQPYDELREYELNCANQSIINQNLSGANFRPGSYDYRDPFCFELCTITRYTLNRWNFSDASFKNSDLSNLSLIHI